MKKKIFMLLALAMTVMTASALDFPTYSLNKADGAEAHGAIKFIVGETENATSAKEGETVTVVITAKDGWAVGTPSGQWFAKEAAARRTSVDLLSGFELTKLLGQDNTWSFVMQRANAELAEILR